MHVITARLGRCFLLALLAWLLAMSYATSQPAQAKEDGLRAGEFVWAPELAPSGPLAVIVSLPTQRAYVYRNGVRIGISTVSTGRPGYETPSGVYSILQKHREHYSNLYDNAPMPYMQRLTWDGLALHAGGLPGYPASHGCVRLPTKFAEQLFAATTPGSIVVIAAADTFPPSVVTPGLFSPVEPTTGAAVVPLPASGTSFEWFPERSPEGPLTVLLSTGDRRLIVLRNGIEIGRSELSVNGEPIAGTQAYMLLEGTRPEPSVVVPDRPARRWLSLAVPSHEGTSPELGEAVKTGRLVVPRDFARIVYDVLRPGSTVIVTDEPLEPGAGNVTVMEAEAKAPPEQTPDPDRR